jgi:hypothetical protein
MIMTVCEKGLLVEKKGVRDVYYCGQINTNVDAFYSEL